MTSRTRWTGKVDPSDSALGLTDYTFIIKNPMDLGSVSEKLRTDKYRFVEEALDDLQLIWDNCKSYNHPDTVSKVLFSGYTRQQKI